MTLNAQQLTTYFTDHLNRIYCGKQHIVSRFPALVQNAEFNDIKLAIEETVEDVHAQVKRMKAIYDILDVEAEMGPCYGLNALLDEASDAITQQKHDPLLRDMAILFYLQNIEVTEIASFQVLRMVARALNNKDIEQLLLENFDEARDDRNLLLSLTRKYLPGQ